MKLALTTLLALAAVANAAHAQLLIPTGQDRRVVVSAEATEAGRSVMDADLDQAADFGTFQASVSASATQGSAFGMSAASQDSTLFATSFEGTGTISASSGDGAGSALAEAESDATLEFEVTDEFHWSVTGRIEGYDRGFAEFYLHTQSGTFINGEIGIGEGPLVVDRSGELPAGVYRIQFRAFSELGASGPAFAEYELVLELTPLGGNYCTAAPNSVGAGAVLASSGSHSLAANDFQLEAHGGLPGGSGLFYYGAHQIQAPFGDGFRCVGGPTFRLQPPIQNDGAGSGARLVDFAAPPAGQGAGAILPGSTWNFQLWYRDPMGPGGSGFNVSDGLWATFRP